MSEKFAHDFRHSDVSSQINVDNLSQRTNWQHCDFCIPPAYHSDGVLNIPNDLYVQSMGAPQDKSAGALLVEDDPFMGRGPPPFQACRSFWTKNVYSG